MIEFLKEKRKIIVIILAIIILGGYYIIDLNQEENVIEEQEILISENKISEENEVSDEEEEIIVIHIAGAVKNPGIVKVKQGSRIEDVIEAAGGLSEDGDITNVNLAYVVEDGMKIKIPSINDEFEDGENYITEDGGDGVIVSDDYSSSSSLVNINTATQTELETLSGIGPSLATKIIEYREANGKFKTIEDIKNVSGIGDSKFESIKDYIEV